MGCNSYFDIVGYISYEALQELDLFVTFVWIIGETSRGIHGLP